METQKRRRTWSYRNHIEQIDEHSCESQTLPIPLNNNKNSFYETSESNKKIIECIQESEHNIANESNNNFYNEKMNYSNEKNCNCNINITKNNFKEENVQMASLRYLDNSQRAAVTFPPFVPLLIQAGAGSGKTQTMATRVAYLIYHYHIPPRAILGICFTRQAAETLRERVRCILAQEMNLTASTCNSKGNYYNNTNTSKEVETSHSELPLMSSSSSTNKCNSKLDYTQENNLNSMLAEMKLRTMHSFALEILRRYNCIDSSTNVFDAKLQRRLAWRVVEQFAMQEKSSEAVDELIGFVNKMKTRVHVNSEFAEPHYNKQAVYLFPFYERLLHEEQNAVDFGDLLQMFLELLVERESSQEEEQYYEKKCEYDIIEKSKEGRHLENTKSNYRVDNNSNTKTKKKIENKNELISTKQIPSEICLLLRKRFTHIVVDEFQDFNEIQLEILALLAGEEEYPFSPSHQLNNTNTYQSLQTEHEECKVSQEEQQQKWNKRQSCQVTCVGDPHQCIYAWRGALPKIFKTWSERFPQTHILTLSTNYRSTPEIINVSNKLVHSSQVPFTANSSSWSSSSSKEKLQLNCPVTLLTCDTIADEAEGLIYLLEHYVHHEQEISCNCEEPTEEQCNTEKNNNMDKNININSETSTTEENNKEKQMYRSVFTTYSDVAILCRTRKRVQQMLDILDMHHIPSSHLQRTLSDNCTILQALLSYLRVCVDLESCQDEDVRMVLSHSPACLTARARKELFFSLDAVVREKMSEQEHKTKSIHEHSMEIKDKWQQSANRKIEEENNINKFVESDSNNHAHPNKATIMKKISYYTLLRELVFYNFAAERFPKLQVSKKSQKTIRSFIKLSTEVASMLSRQTCNVDDVLQFVIQEGGFEHAMHQHTVLTNNGNNNKGSKEKNDNEKQKNKKDNIDGNNNKRHKSPLAASLAKSVAQEFSTKSTLSEEEQESNKSKKRQYVNANTENDDNADETNELLADAHLSLSELLLQAYYEVLQMTQHESEENNMIETESVSSKSKNNDINNNGEMEALHNIYQNTFYDNDDKCFQSSNAKEVKEYKDDKLVNSKINNYQESNPAMILRRVIDQFISLLPSDDFGSLCFPSHSTNTNNTLPEENNNSRITKNKNFSAGKVTVGTVHQAKGMEWPIVIIPGCWVGEFPIRTNSEEERRIFYVALTRAMRELYLITADKYSDTLDGLSDATCGASVQQTPYLNCINDQLRKVRLSSLMQQTTTNNNIISSQH